MLNNEIESPSGALNSTKMKQRQSTTPPPFSFAQRAKGHNEPRDVPGASSAVARWTILDDHYSYDFSFEPLSILGVKDFRDEVNFLCFRYRRRENPEDFFKVGRVFTLLWHEPIDPTNTVMSYQTRTESQHGKEIHSTIRRMIVVREVRRGSWCIEIKIDDKRESGVSQKTEQASPFVHLVHTRGYIPYRSRLVNNSIAIAPTSPEEEIDPMSQVNFSEVFIVEHSVEVRDIGLVDTESMPHLMSYLKAETGL